MAEKTKQERIDAALEVATVGQVDGDHHKAWVIDQIVRELTGSKKAYKRWVKAYCDGEDGPETYDWDTGVAP